MYALNADGSIARQDNPDGSWLSSTYDAAGNTLSRTEPTETYDAALHPYDLAVQSFAYDRFGNQIQATDAGGVDTFSTYDCLDRCVASTRQAPDKASGDEGDDTTTTTTYDACSRAVASETRDLDSDGHADSDYHATTDYNPDGSVACQKNGTVETSFTYDVAGRPLTKSKSIADDDSATQVSEVRYTYDDLGRLIDELDLQGKASHQSVNTRQTTFAYDTLGRQTDKLVTQMGAVPASPTANAAPAAATATPTPSASPTPQQSASSEPQAASPAPDSSPLVPSPSASPDAVTDTAAAPDSAATATPAPSPTPTAVLEVKTSYPSYADDSHTGDMTLQTTICGSLTIDTAIDDRGRQQTQEASLPDGPNGSPESVAWVPYRDQADRLTEVWIESSQDRIPRGSNFNYSWPVEFYSYGPRGRLDTQWGTGFASDAKPSDSYSYSSASGLRSAEHLDLPAFGGQIDEHYTYQTDGRLKSASGTKYRYASSGNLTAIEAEATTHLHYYANRLQRLSVGESDASPLFFNWNPTNGWRIAQGPFDVAGEQIVSQPQRTIFDAAGRLFRYLDSDAHTRATFTYDGAGQRIAAKLETGRDLPPAQQRITQSAYTWDGTHLLALSSTTTDGQTIPQTKASWQLFYLYGDDGHPCAGLYENLRTGNVDIFTIVTDDRNDVLELLDGAGVAFASYRYDVWGKATRSDSRATNSSDLGGLLGPGVADEIANANRLRYAGYLYDDVSGLYYCQSRYYDPKTRAFLSRDPAAADGLESAYQYCGGNPVETSDPTGTLPRYVGLDRLRGWTSRDREAANSGDRYYPGSHLYYDPVGAGTGDQLYFGKDLANFAFTALGALDKGTDYVFWNAADLAVLGAAGPAAPFLPDPDLYDRHRKLTDEHPWWAAAMDIPKDILLAKGLGYLGALGDGADAAGGAGGLRGVASSGEDSFSVARWRGTTMDDDTSLNWHYATHGDANGLTPAEYFNQAEAFSQGPEAMGMRAIKPGEYKFGDGTLGTKWVSGPSQSGPGGYLDNSGNIIDYWPGKW